MNQLNELNNNKYAYLRHLSMEELLELLTIAPIPAVSPEKQAYVDALKEAIIEKENENPTGFFPDVDQQWEQFVTHYMPDLSKAALESEPEKHAVTAQTSHQPIEAPQKRVVRFSRFWRTALVAVAAIACMFAAMLTAQAAGVDVFGTMARWTKDVFSFGQVAPDSEVSDNLAQETETPDPNRVYSSLQEAFDAYGMTEVHEPNWLPEGYALDGIDVMSIDDPFVRSFSVSYSDGQGRIGIDIVSYEGEPITQVQKIDISVESIEKNGVTFYLVENTVGGTIAWHTEQYEYYISTSGDKDILWEIADSMFIGTNKTYR